MKRKQALGHGKELLAVVDEQGERMFDSLALFAKPRESGQKLYSISVRDLKSGEMLRFWTTHEVHRFLKAQKRKSRTHVPFFNFIHRA
jgi:hypothetical protein